MILISIGLIRIGVRSVFPDDVVPQLAVFLKGTSFGINVGISLDVVPDVVRWDLEVKLFSVHGVGEARLGASCQLLYTPASRSQGFRSENAVIR